MEEMFIQQECVRFLTISLQGKLQAHKLRVEQQRNILIENEHVADKKAGPNQQIRTILTLKLVITCAGPTNHSGDLLQTGRTWTMM